MRRLGHVPALDGIRGVAILLVLGVHSHSLVPGGGLGVDLFFVLSGFLITSLLLGEWGVTGAIDLRAFYRRRALRLLPALIVMLVAYSVVASLLHVQHAPSGALLGLTYTFNGAAAWFGFQALGLDHLWSLAAEEQFYLLWPPILCLALARRINPRLLALGLALAVLAFASWRAELVLHGAWGQRLHGPDARVDPIVLGCLAGVVYTFGFVRRVPNLLAYFWLLVAATMVAAVWVETPEVHNIVGIPLFSLGAAVVLLGVALEPNRLLARWLAARPLCYLGRVSYGLYLWHVPVFVAIGWKAGIPASLAIAALSYRFVERPFLRRKRRYSPTVGKTRDALPEPAPAA